MRSFVKPSFAAKFGVATATSAAMVVSPMVVLPASAATISVTTCDADGASLLSAVATAEGSSGADVIEINIAGDCTMTLDESIYISDSTTIKNVNATDDVYLRRTQGDGYVVEVQKLYSSIELVLEGLHITGVDGFQETERLIYFNGDYAYPSSLTIRDTTVSGGGSGGLFVQYAVTLTVDNSSFTNNQQAISTRYGGAIRMENDVDATFTDSYFADNGWVDYYINGGAVYASDSSVTIDHSTFNRNLAAWGGALYIKDSDLTFEGELSTFTGNGVEYSDLTDAGLTGHGGAIDVHGVSSFVANAPLTFDGNKSGEAGAIRFNLEYDTTVQFNDNVTFLNNFAQRDGGAIGVYVYVDVPDFDVQIGVEFNGSVTQFTGNEAGGFYSPFPMGNGGAIAVDEDSNYRIDYTQEQLVTMEFNSATTSFVGNYAEDDGGAIYIDTEDGYAVLDFVDETTPGYVYFGTNDAADDGGAIYLEGGDDADGQSKLYLDGARFVNNYADSDGIIYLEDASAYVYNSEFSGNYATNGAVFYLEDDNNDAYVRADYNRFFFNRARGDGGVFYLEDGANFSLHSNFFMYNRSRGEGSVVAMDPDNNIANYLVFEQNTVYRNSANYLDSDSSAPAALSLGQSSYGRITFNTFAGNYSPNGDLALSIEHNSNYAGALAIYGNIFASWNDGAVIDTGASDNVLDGGFNLLTGPSGQSLDGGQNTVEDYSAALRDGRSLMVTWEQLALGAPTVNDGNPDNSGVLPTMALGESSVAIDFLPTSFGPWAAFAPERDARGVTRFSSSVVAHGLGIDSGAFESIHTFVPQDEEPEGTSPNVVITHVSKSAIQAAGDSIVVYGRGLDDVTELYFNGTKVSFVKQADGSLLVTTPALPTGEVVISAYASDGTAVLQHAFWVVDTLEFSTWTRHVGDTIKIYAKNVIGRGKVQFFVDGKEIAWVNAVDATDPKLRTANGYHYLVRTVQLKADGSKTRFEVKLNGERVRRNTYTINSN